MTTVDNNNAYFDWAAGADGNITQTGPTVYCGNCLRMTADGYAAGGGDWDNGSDAAVALYNAAIMQVCEELAGDGIDVAHVDPTAYYEPSTDVGADDVHPSDTGHANLATAFLAIIDNNARPIDRQLPTEYLRLRHNLTATSAPGVTNDLTEGYAVGSRCFDLTADAEYVCLDATNGAAVWSGTTGGAITLDAHAANTLDVTGMETIVILIPIMVVLIGTAIALMTKTGRAAIYNPSAHGFSEVLYEFSSAGNNNGSAFAGLGANTPFYNIGLGIAMFIARYWLAIPILAIAGSLANKKKIPAGSGTLPLPIPRCLSPGSLASSSSRAH